MKISELKKLLEPLDETRRVFINIGFVRNLSYIYKDNQGDLLLSDSMSDYPKLLYEDEEYIFGLPKPEQGDNNGV